MTKGGDAIFGEGINKIIAALLTLCTLIAFAGMMNFGIKTASAGTVIPGGSITSDETWTLAGSPYWVQDAITVEEGVTLTIEPGVWVKVRKDFGMHLHIKGNLTAIGTPSQRIHFTSNESSPASKDWGNVWIYSTGNAVIDYCNITYGNHGVAVFYASNVSVTNSNFIFNEVGIDLRNATKNLIKGNLISQNKISNIILRDSENNTFTNNNITLSDQFGLYSENSVNNKIYHNNFIDNWIPQAVDNLNGNFWNDTYPSGGNYWSDWSPITPDLYSGAITPQTTGSPDGICDNPFYIDVDSVDYYPLKYPFGSPRPDIELPIIEDVNVTPEPQEVDYFVNISAIVGDNEQVDEVWINITDPNGVTIGNFSMDYNITNDRYYYNATYGMLGTYLFTIWANDTNNNWNFTSSFFTIEDLTLPLITNVISKPGTQKVFDSVNVSATIIDNYNLSSVWINISKPDGSSINTTMNKSLGNSFYLNKSYNQVGVYDFTIWANDTSNNWNFTLSSFMIGDFTAPSISDVISNPEIQDIFDNVNISATISDNYDLYGVWLNISYPDGSSINITMNETLGSIFYLNKSYDQPGVYNFTIWANDTSNNWNFENGSFSIQDTGQPQASAEISLPYWKNMSTFEVTWTASDNLGLSNITLLYRYSADNSIWGSWIEYSCNNTVSGPSASGIFQFLAPVNGYYEFFVNASDSEGNWEPDAPIAEAITAVDTLPPTSNINPLSLYWINFLPLSLEASATDGLSGVKDVALWYRYSVNNISWGFWKSFATDQIEPWTWSFDFPNGEGYYDFYSIGKDYANNVELKTLRDALCAYDFTPPTAYAGEDQEGEPGTTMNFDGSGSTDNFGIISNFTWTITKDSVVISILNGLNPTFNFDVVGEYIVTLTVKDPSGNIDDDIMIVSIITEFIDVEQPEIMHSAIPTNQEVHFGVNITAEVSDNVEVFGVWVQILDSKNDELRNVTMARVGLSDDYWYGGIYSTVGIFNYTIWANDTSDNWALAYGSFVIQDTTPPIADAGENLTINLSETTYFDGSRSTDNVEIINYTWNISMNEILIVTLYGIYPNYKFDNTGIYNVTLTVRDAVGNIDNDIIIVIVESPEKPSKPDYYWLIIIIILIIAVIIFYLLVRRRKKKTPEEDIQPIVPPTQPFGSQTSPKEEMPLPPREEVSLDPNEREDELSSVVYTDASYIKSSGVIFSFLSSYG